uniref:Uncharacterized protein n=1 Tax=Monodon monoceros TaxID=40151 RepID=A0A8C6BCK2_MONMO
MRFSSLRQLLPPRLPPFRFDLYFPRRVRGGGQCRGFPTSLSFLDSQFSSLKVTSSSRSFCRANPTKNKMPEDSLAQLNQEDDIKKN